MAFSLAEHTDDAQWIRTRSQECGLKYLSDLKLAHNQLLHFVVHRTRRMPSGQDTREDIDHMRRRYPDLVEPGAQQVVKAMKCDLQVFDVTASVVAKAATTASANIHIRWGQSYNRTHSGERAVGSIRSKTSSHGLETQ